MKHVYARQIAPEAQESPLEWFGDSEVFSTFGNKRFRESMTDIVERVKNTLDGGDFADEIDAIAGNGWHEPRYDGCEECVMDYLPPENGGKYNKPQIAKLCEIAREYRGDGSSHDLDKLVEVLSIVTGVTYDWTTIRGCCQGDWNYCVFPAKENPNRFEVEYFNLGTEWMVCETENEEELNPDEVNDWSMYCYNWDEEEMRKEIADAAGCKPDQVTMYKWAGYIKSSKYEKVC